MNLQLILRISTATVTLLISCAGTHSDVALRETSFNKQWRFYRGSLESGYATTFDDSAWRILDLPHDFSIEHNSNPNTEAIGPFSRMSPGGPSTGHVLGGVAWYRKHFTLNEFERNGQVSVLFDGVYMNADVWINGKHLGNHPYGYTAFSFDLTEHLHTAGIENILAVEVKNEGKNSRWYSGSGIYRNVSLITTGPLYIKQWGAYITTPAVTSTSADVQMEIIIVNAAVHTESIDIRCEILNPDGKAVASSLIKSKVKAGEKSIEKLSLEVSDPQLWSDQSPNLYTALIRVSKNGRTFDQTTERFGIRSIVFSPEKGFLLNGNPTLLKGACIHHDNGLLGAAAFKQAEYRKIAILKENGFNAIRTAHNPPSKFLLDACDQLGMLVIDEAFDQWQRPKNEEDYSLYFDQWWENDIEAMILRDRNHPSVIAWSFGNEINERADSSGLKIARSLIDKIHALDPSRPATQAICKFWEHPEKSWKESEPAFALLDVHSYNYQWSQYQEDHKNFPERIMIGTESFPIEAYTNWKMVEDHPYVIGDFVWTGMDYLGESGIAHTVYKDNQNEEWLGLADWPWFNAWCGDIDILGNKKAQSYFRDVVWQNSNLEIAVHEPVPEGMHEYLSAWAWPNEYQSWNWLGHEGVPLQVSIYSRCQQVILKLNNQVIDTLLTGEKQGLINRVEIPFQAGTLMAVGINEGKEVTRKVLQTTGPAFQLKMTPEKERMSAEVNELFYFNIEVQDSQGRFIPNAEVTVTFRMEGKCQLLSAGNGNPQDMKSFHSSEVKTFMGRCQLIVRSFEDADKITVTARSKGLRSASSTVSLI